MSDIFKSVFTTRRRNTPTMSSRTSFRSAVMPAHTSNPYPFKRPDNDPYKVIDSAGTRLKAAGQEVPKPKKVGTLLLGALDLLQRPQYMITNPIKRITEGETNPVELLKSSFKGLIGKERSYTTDILENLGWSKARGKTLGAKASNVGRFLVGFAGDVALDPTTYIGVGATKHVGDALKKAGKLDDVVKSIKKISAVSGATGDIGNIAQRITDFADTTSAVLQGTKKSTRFTQGAKKMFKDMGTRIHTNPKARLAEITETLLKYKDDLVKKYGDDVAQDVVRFAEFIAEKSPDSALGIMKLGFDGFNKNTFKYVDDILVGHTSGKTLTKLSEKLRDTVGSDRNLRAYVSKAIAEKKPIAEIVDYLKKRIGSTAMFDISGERYGVGLFDNMTLPELRKIFDSPKGADILRKKGASIAEEFGYSKAAQHFDELLTPGYKGSLTRKLNAWAKEGNVDAINDVLGVLDMVKDLYDRSPVGRAQEFLKRNDPKESFAKIMKSVTGTYKEKGALELGRTATSQTIQGYRILNVSHKKTLTKIDFANKLSLHIDKARKVSYFKFAGKPIFETTKYTNKFRSATTKVLQHTVPDKASYYIQKFDEFFPDATAQKYPFIRRFMEKRNITSMKRLKPANKRALVEEYARQKGIDLAKEYARKKLGSNIVRPVRHIVDILTQTFKPGKATHGLKMMSSDKALTAFETVSKQITKYSQIESGIPHEALQSVVNLFGHDFEEILTDTNIQEAMFFAIQRWIPDDDFSTLAWLTIERGYDEVAAVYGKGTDMARTVGEYAKKTKLSAEDAELKKVFDHFVELEDSGALKKFDDLHKALFNTYGDEIFEKLSANVHKNLAFNHMLLDVEVAQGLRLDEAMPSYIGHADIRGYIMQNLFWTPEEVTRVNLGETTGRKVSQKLRQTMGFTDERKFISAAMAMAREPKIKHNTNVLAAATIRMHESSLMQLNRSFFRGIKDMIDEGMEGIDELATLNKHYASKHKWNTDKALKIHDKLTNETHKVFVAPELMSEFERIINLSMTEGASKIIKTLDQMTGMLKTAQTRLQPSFLLRNLIGENFMNYMAGVDVESYKIAHDVLKQLRRTGDDMTAGRVVHVGRMYTVDGTLAYALEGNKLYEFKPEYVARMQSVESFKYSDLSKDYVAPDSLEGHRAWSKVVEADTPEQARSKLHELLAQRTSEGMKVKSVGGRGMMSASEESVSSVSLYNLGDTTYTATELYEEFSKRGLTFSGATRGNLYKDTNATVREEINLISGNPLRRMSQRYMNFGDNTETIARFSHFLDAIKKGNTLDDAADIVRKYHVDYKDITKVEKNIFRRLMPYYTYMRKNLEIQLNAMLAHPGKFAMIGHLINNSYKALEGNVREEEMLTPDYYEENWALPLGMDNAGNVRYLNWQLPLGDLSRIRWVTNGKGKLDAWDSMKEMFRTNGMDMLHPLLKSIFAYDQNSMLSYDMPIEKYAGEKTDLFPGYEGVKVGADLDYALQQTGAGQTLRRFVGTLLGGGQDPEHPLTLNPDSRPGYFAPFVKSITPTRNINKTRAAYAYRYRDELLDYIEMLKKQKGINVPNSADLRTPVRHDTYKNLYDYVPNYRR